MRVLLVSVTLFSVAQGVYEIRTFGDAAMYKDECVRQHAARGSSLIDYMRRVPMDAPDDDGRWCVIRCILQKSDLMDTIRDELIEAHVHEQMQYSNAIVEDPDDIRSETERCLREPAADTDGGACQRAYTFFACIQSTEYDLF
ncbi:uncharacterized protein LOC128729198 [Anopheles nili]|uniref:uncharacterized protein LOC128729198 n=1 Tax=Anopheles nili TaxID=185578 RepID=UPI00237A3718|nr:uncharacterized protein LOC128729198 [Anopheles nili]